MPKLNQSFHRRFVRFELLSILATLVASVECRNGEEALVGRSSTSFLREEMQSPSLHSLKQIHRPSILDLFDDLQADHSISFDSNLLRNGRADILSAGNAFDSDIENDLFYHDLQLSTVTEMQSPLSSLKERPQSKFEQESKSKLKTKLLKTGTTIVGCLANENQVVVLAADTRATSNTIVADKRCEKVHCLAPNVWCCGAGTSGDIDALVRQVKYTFLMRNRIDGSIGNIHNTESYDINKLDIASVFGICKYIRSQLFPSRGEIGANLVVGGYDYDIGNAVLAAIHPHGSMDTTIPFTALGSGGLAAMSVLEAYYKPNLTLEGAKALAVRAVKAGIDNDLGSGSQVDICIITRHGVEYKRAYLEEEHLVVNERDNLTEDILYQRHSKDDDGIMGGVNGFGSLPYHIRSKRKIVENEMKTEQEKKKWIRQKLSLTKNEI